MKVFPETAKVLEMVRYFVPGAVYSRGMDYVLGSKNVEDALANAPEGTFAIQFFDKLYVEIEYDGEIIPLFSASLDPSPLIFTKGKLLHRNEFLNEYPSRDDIVEQMDNIGVNRVVVDGGNFRPFDEDKDIFWPSEKYRSRWNHATEKV